MQTFPVSEPVAAMVDVDAASIRIIASARNDVTVGVRALNPARQADVDAAGGTVVSCNGGRLHVAGPRQRFRLLSRPGTVSVTIEVPEHSSLHVSSASGDIAALGRLAACTLRTQAGSVQADSVTEADLHTQAGNLALREASGRAKLETKSGSIRVGSLSGGSSLSTSAGDITVESCIGDLAARTSYGEIRVGSATSGEATLTSGYGSIAVGIPAGTAAYVEAWAERGEVRNGLTSFADRPDRPQTVQLKATTQHGSITVERA
jgi:DUF4097 and DUF4098 domain-containing protein YvlB